MKDIFVLESFNFLNNVALLWKLALFSDILESVLWHITRKKNRHFKQKFPRVRNCLPNLSSIKILPSGGVYNTQCIITYITFVLFAEGAPAATLDIKMLKEEDIAIKKEYQTKRNLTYGTHILCRVNFHYLNIYISLLLSRMIVMNHLKIKLGFRIGLGLSFPNPRMLLKDEIRISISYQESPGRVQKKDKI